MLRNCNYCNLEYNAEQRYLSRGQGQYCSRSCSSTANAKNRGKLEPNVVCALCTISFYKSPSKLSKSKSKLYFCSRKHKDKAQRIGGITEIQPPHYGTSSLDYRSIAFRFLPNECAKCGYKKYLAVLEVNHKDYDRSNNTIENLEILCPTCHTEFHYETKTGCWGEKPG